MIICDYSKVTKLFHFSLADNIGAYILMNYYFCFKFFLCGRIWDGAAYFQLVAHW